MMWPTATQYMEAIQNPGTCFSDPELKDDTPAVDHLGMPFVSSGQFAYVFKLNQESGKASAVRCFRGFVGDREQRYSAIDEHLARFPVSVLANFEYDPDGVSIQNQKFPILVMEWIEGPTLDVYIGAVLQKRDVLLYLADQWIKVVKSLRQAQIAHGDLQHGNIIVQNGVLRIVDLDGMFVPSMVRMRSIETGHRHYQHPRRDEFLFNREMDNFSALVIYVSLLALADRPDLWKKFHDENLIFTRSDFLSPGKSELFREIRGISSEHKRLADVLEKACAASPSATPALVDLVTPKSTLPAWMVQPVGVTVTTTTREASPTRVGYSRVAAVSGVGSATPVPGSLHQIPSAQAASVRTAVASNVPSPSHGHFNWDRIITRTFSIAVAFGLTGLLFSPMWYPLIDGTYRDLGAAGGPNTTIWTYILVCLAFGFFRSLYEAARRPSATTSTPYIPSPVQYRAPQSAQSSGVGRLPQSGSVSRPPVPIVSRGGAGSVIASRTRLIYHRPNCDWARKISGSNRTPFTSSRDAQAAGYRACRVCRPI